MHTIPISFINHANAIETIWCLDSTNSHIILAETIKNYDSGYISIDQIFEALGYFAIYHLKELETIYNFCTQLINKYQITKIMSSIKSHSLRYILKQSGYTDKSSEQSTMNEHIFAIRQNNLHFAKTWSIQEIIYVYSFQSIEFAILNDDINLFKEFFNNPTPPRAKITMIDSPYYPELSIIDACAYYGAQKCFFYLLENHIKLTENSFKCSIIGGNTKIILACESNKIDNSFLDIAINAHHFAVAKWLETKYKLIFSWVTIMETKNYRFMLYKLRSNCEVLDSQKNTIMTVAERIHDQDVINYIRSVFLKRREDQDKLDKLINSKVLKSLLAPETMV